MQKNSSHSKNDHHRFRQTHRQDARDARAMNTLGADELQLLLNLLDPVPLLRAGRVNRAMRAVVVEITHGCHIDLSSSSSGEVTVTTLRSALLMSKEEADAFEFEVAKQDPLGRYATYLQLSVAMEHAVRTLGGWAEVARRVEKKRERDRKREDLRRRKIQALEKRCEALNAWAEKYELLGKHTTVKGWIMDHIGTCLVSQDLRDYVEKPALKPHLTFEAAKEKLKATVKIASERESRQVALLAALDRLKLALRPGSSLCNQFLRGDSPHSAETVAATMAYMHWLHSHTNGAYKAAVRAEVLVLRDELEMGYFYGIRREAADSVKWDPEFSPPEKWPWLDDEVARTAQASPKLALRRN